MRDDCEDDDDTARSTGVAKHEVEPRRQRKRMGSEQDDSNDLSEIPLASVPVPNGPARSCTSKTHIRKNPTCKPRGNEAKNDLREWSNINSHVTIIAESEQLKFVFDGHECTHPSLFDLDSPLLSHLVMCLRCL